MPSKPRGWRQTLLFTAALGIVLGAIVSIVSVVLAPRQAENESRERRAVLESMLGCEPDLVALLEDTAGAGAAGLDPRVVDLDSGCYETDVDAACLDAEAAATDALQRLVLAPGDDLASIGDRPNRVVVYEVRHDGKLLLLVLPVYGAGYQSRLEGYLSLEGDLQTVSSLVFYAHGETPGMGARIGEADWQATWRGKRTHDEAGQLRIGVGRREGGPTSRYEVDAMSGATRTGQGVTNLLRFWLGDLGYAPLIRNLRSGAACARAAD